MYAVTDIVNFFLSRSSMSPKKLQKLLYYAYAWTLSLLNDKINEMVEAIPSLHEYKNGRNPTVCGFPSIFDVLS